MFHAASPKLPHELPRAFYKTAQGWTLAIGKTTMSLPIVVYC